MRGSGAGVVLRRAAIEGNVSNAISILECHTDVQNETDETGWTALIAAAYPAGPPPIIIKSNFSVTLSFFNKIQKI